MSSVVPIWLALKFGTVTARASRKADTLLASLKVIQESYVRRGLLVRIVLANNKFASLETPLSSLGIALNTVARDNHVLELKSSIYTLAKRYREALITLPIRPLPNYFFIELEKTMSFWLRVFPAPNGVSLHISSRKVEIDTCRRQETLCGVLQCLRVETREAWRFHNIAHYWLYSFQSDW